MKVGRLAMQSGYSLLAVLVLMGASPSPARAQGHDAHAQTSQRHDGSDQKNQNALVKAIREANGRFKDVSVAEAEGYGLMFGCVSGSDAGAMGMHFVNGALIGDDVVDPARPEIVIYEPASNGRLKLIGADFLIFADVWHKKHPNETPQLMGQLFHLFEAPNRFGLPPFYTLHVWAWKDSPTGTFVNWHANVSCDGFNGETR